MTEITVNNRTRNIQHVNFKKDNQVQYQDFQVFLYKSKVQNASGENQNTKIK